MEIFSVATLHTAYQFIFSIGLGLGLGASVLSHILFLFSGVDEKISKDEINLLSISRVAVWIAILLYAFGGLGLFTLAYESMLEMGIFYASMTVATILISSEITFTLRHLPRMRTIHKGRIALDAFVLESGAVSAVSWAFLMFHHVIYRTDIGYFAFMALYAVAVALSMLATWLVRRRRFRLRDTTVLKRSVVAALFFALTFAGAWYAKADRFVKPAEIGKRIVSEVVGVTYTLDDVALHNNAEDCWLVIDKKVFNATEASRLHPAMFNCGKDSSENYHKNHGAGIRDKMMKYHIGELRDGTGLPGADISPDKNKTLKPYRELYIDEGSWNPRELMFVVEKDAEKLLVIDGATHKTIGRVHDVGFQPHTSVYSSDAKYMYIISRDGWLTKINLATLEPVVSVLVGKNSRGTAITDNDKYIAIGNYEPGNLVILDAISMEILKTIPLTVEKDGKQIESRAGAVVEKGNRIIVALKDGTSVWAIDTDQPGFPVTHKFSDIGEGKPALHDAFLTPNGSHYIVASQGSKTIWILDVATMKPVAEVQTGETPHTGPGAAWGNYIYIPSLGEGLITVVDITTWKPVKYIKTSLCVG
jgi:DNA-binding beta-propeller fold protein YncE